MTPTSVCVADVPERPLDRRWAAPGSVVSGGGIMVRSAESVIVARGPDEIFRYVADLRNEPSRAFVQNLKRVVES
jgi:hypothetical protein